MAKILDVFVPGRPKATPRPRAFANKDGKVRAYKPNTAESWKTEIAIGLRKHRLKTPAEGPIRVDLVFYMPPGKPDRDNLDKAVLDALTTLRFWIDDSQVCSGRIVKRYESGQGPGCQIHITQLEAS